MVKYLLDYRCVFEGIRILAEMKVEDETRTTEMAPFQPGACERIVSQHIEKGVTPLTIEFGVVVSNKT